VRRFFDSSDGVRLMGTFPPEPPTPNDSRQVRRASVRAAAFCQISQEHPQFPRRVRRTIARHVRMTKGGLPQ
jgi:hypothetical protein